MPADPGGGGDSFLQVVKGTDYHYTTKEFDPRVYAECNYVGNRTLIKCRNVRTREQLHGNNGLCEQHSAFSAQLADISRVEFMRAETDGKRKLYGADRVGSVLCEDDPILSPMHSWKPSCEDVVPPIHDDHPLKNAGVFTLKEAHKLQIENFEAAVQSARLLREIIVEQGRRTVSCAYEKIPDGEKMAREERRHLQMVKLDVKQKKLLAAAKRIIEMDRIPLMISEVRKKLRAKRGPICRFGHPPRDDMPKEETTMLNEDDVMSTVSQMVSSVSDSRFTNADPEIVSVMESIVRKVSGSEAEPKVEIDVDYVHACSKMALPGSIFCKNHMVQYDTAQNFIVACSECGIPVVNLGSSLCPMHYKKYRSPTPPAHPPPLARGSVLTPLHVKVGDSDPSAPPTVSMSESSNAGSQVMKQFVLDDSDDDEEMTSVASPAPLAPTTSKQQHQPVEEAKETLLDSREERTMVCARTRRFSRENFTKRSVPFHRQKRSAGLESPVRSPQPKRPYTKKQGTNLQRGGIYGAGSVYQPRHVSEDQSAIAGIESELGVPDQEDPTQNVSPFQSLLQPRSRKTIERKPPSRNVAEPPHRPVAEPHRRVMEPPHRTIAEPPRRAMPEPPHRVITQREPPNRPIAEPPHRAMAEPPHRAIAEPPHRALPEREPPHRAMVEPPHRRVMAEPPHRVSLSTSFGSGAGTAPAPEPPKEPLSRQSSTSSNTSGSVNQPAPQMVRAGTGVRVAVRGLSTTSVQQQEPEMTVAPPSQPQARTLPVPPHRQLASQAPPPPRQPVPQPQLTSPQLQPQPRLASGGQGAPPPQQQYVRLPTSTALPATSARKAGANGGQRQDSYAEQLRAHNAQPTTQAMGNQNSAPGFRLVAATPAQCAAAGISRASQGRGISLVSTATATQSHYQMQGTAGGGVRTYAVRQHNRGLFPNQKPPSNVAYIADDESSAGARYVVGNVQGARPPQSQSQATSGLYQSGPSQFRGQLPIRSTGGTMVMQGRVPVQTVLQARTQEQQRVGQTGGPNAPRPTIVPPHRLMQPISTAPTVLRTAAGASAPVPAPAPATSADDASRTSHPGTSASTSSASLDETIAAVASRSSSANDARSSDASKSPTASVKPSEDQSFELLPPPPPAPILEPQVTKADKKPIGHMEEEEQMDGLSLLASMASALRTENDAERQQKLKQQQSEENKSLSDLPPWLSEERSVTGSVTSGSNSAQGDASKKATAEAPSGPATRSSLRKRMSTSGSEGEPLIKRSSLRKRASLAEEKKEDRAINTRSGNRMAGGSTYITMTDAEREAQQAELLKKLDEEEYDEEL